MDPCDPMATEIRFVNLLKCAIIDKMSCKKGFGNSGRETDAKRMVVWD